MGSSLGILSLNTGASYRDRFNAEHFLSDLSLLNTCITKLGLSIIALLKLQIFFYDFFKFGLFLVGASPHRYLPTPTWMLLMMRLKIHSCYLSSG